MKSRIRIAVSFCLTVFLAIHVGLGQDTTATITGTVRDPSGAIVPSARITVDSQTTGFVRTAVTDTAGSYKIPFVPVGVYRVTAEADGFKTQIEQNVRLEILETRTVDFHLELGSASEKVSVQAQASQLETESSEAGTVIRNEQINNLPLNVRQFMQLIFLAPMATPATNDFRSFEVNRNTAVPAGAGQRPEQNNYQIDGVDNRESGRNGFAVAPPVDSVGEFIVQTGLAPAEFGRGGGAIINVVTKNGTNDYHGSLYEFLRNDKLDARPYFSNQKSPLKRNQFGASAGGPVIHDKLFFFANYEGFQQAATGNPPVGLVPTASQRQGIFTTPITDPQNNNAPFPNNAIPATRLSPISTKLLNLFPLPNTADPLRNFVFNAVPSARTQYNNAVARMDYTLSEKDTLYGRYLFDQEVTATPPVLPPPALSGGTNVYLRAQSAGVNWAHVFSPTMVNSATLGYTRYRNQLSTLNSFNQDFITPAGITDTLSATNPLFWAVPNISIPGLLTPSDPTPSFRTMNEYQAEDGLVWNRGRHTFKFGADVQRIQTDMFYTGSNGFWSFSNRFTGNNFADFLLGDPAQVSKTSSAPDWNTWVTYLGTYAQDDWKVTDRLTLNLGLRYEVESAINQSGHCGLGMNLSTGTELVSTQCNTLPAILNFSKTVRPDVLVATTSHTSPYNADVNNVAPRAGFAYQVTPKTVFRGGYGIFYDAPQVESTASSNSFAPNALAPTWTSLPTTPTIGWNPEGSLSAVQAMKGAALTVFPFVSRDFPYGMIQEWNFDVQRQLTSTLFLDVMYQGSHGSHLLVFDNADFKAPGPGNVQALLPYPQYARIQDFAMWGASKYEGGSIKLEQRPWHGLSYMAAFTYSKSMDNVSTLNSAPVWTDPYNRNTAWGPSDFNAPQRFTVAYGYELPIGKNKALFGNVTGVADKIVSGWGIRGITTLQRGLPVSPSMNVSREGICAAACTARPNVVLGQPLYPANQTINHYYFNVNAFAVIPAGGVSGLIGNAGRNILIAPGINDFDFQLYKDTPFLDRQNIEFRWEMYNFFNHTQWGTPAANMESPSTFGVISSTAPPRIMQFVLRYSF
jgi:outer membrane receptor protein involved in Fe transport